MLLIVKVFAVGTVLQQPLKSRPPLRTFSGLGEDKTLQNSSRNAMAKKGLLVFVYSDGVGEYLLK